jgi:ankyrin repeat protein
LTCLFLYLYRAHAAPDPVDSTGITPLCITCQLGLASVAAALLDGAANIEFTPPAVPFVNGGVNVYTPLLIATTNNNTSVVKVGSCRHRAEACAESGVQNVVLTLAKKKNHLQTFLSISFQLAPLHQGAP